MESALRTYQRFSEKEDAESLVALLNDHGLHAMLTTDQLAFDPTFTGQARTRSHQVMLRPDEFLRADEIQVKAGKSAIEEIGSDHPLYAFSDEELIDVLVKPDEWSVLDRQLATKILGDRGMKVDPAFVQALRKQRIAELGRSEPSQKVWVYVGYLLGMMGGLVGMMIGYSLLTTKKTLPNGDKVLAYNEADRESGRWILISGGFFLAIWIIIWMRWWL